MALDRFASWTASTVSAVCGASDSRSSACGAVDRMVAGMENALTESVG